MAQKKAISNLEKDVSVHLYLLHQTTCVMLSSNLEIKMDRFSMRCYVSYLIGK